MSRPTIAELEKILEESGDQKIEIMPDGSVRALDSMMPTYSELQSQLQMSLKRIETLEWLLLEETERCAAIADAAEQRNLHGDGSRTSPEDIAADIRKTPEDKK